MLFDVQRVERSRRINRLTRPKLTNYCSSIAYARSNNTSICKFSPWLFSGNFDERVDDIGGRRLKSGHAQIVDDTVALETTARIPQYVAERILQYELVPQLFNVLPVDRICRARRAVIDVYARWPADCQTHGSYLCEYE